MKSESDKYKYIFGPVVSRRYGLSLGVDMIEPKTCSFNCLFCQIGETSSTTVTPHNTPPAEEIIHELEHWIKNDGRCDIITLAGSGEPTLHSRFGEVLRFIKEHSTYPSLLLSNGSLFFNEKIRKQALSADIVKISLHAWDQESFEKITRADPSLKLTTIIDGYRTFRNIYKGRIDLEVFVLPGINDNPDQMKKIAALARSFSPDSIFLNTAVRPPADSSVMEISRKTLEDLSQFFGEAATRPIIKPQTLKRPYSDESVIRLISRHPATIDQLARQFDISCDKLIEKITSLEKNGVISLKKQGLDIFISRQ